MQHNISSLLPLLAECAQRSGIRDHWMRAVWYGSSISASSFNFQLSHTNIEMKKCWRANRSHFLQYLPQIQSTIWLVFINIINAHRTSNAYTHLMNSNDIWKWKKNDIRSNTFSYSRQDFIKLIKTQSRRAWFDSKPKGKLHQTRQRASARVKTKKTSKWKKKLTETD